MNAISEFVLKQGYLVLFASLFARQIGLPMPAPLFLVAAGALAAAGKLSLLALIGLTITACVLADWIWYEVGRRRGDKVFRFMHRFSRKPASRNHKIFARYGLSLLLIAKFVPGLDAVVQPLAGKAQTSRIAFLAFDAVGAGFYACAYTGLGYFFSNDLDRAGAYASRVGTLLAGLAFIGICIYFSHRLIQRHHAVSIVQALKSLPRADYPRGHCEDPEVAAQAIARQGPGRHEDGDRLGLQRHPADCRRESTWIELRPDRRQTGGIYSLSRQTGSG